MYKCCKCGGECDGSLGEPDPICDKCADRLYPKQRKAWKKAMNKFFDQIDGGG